MREFYSYAELLERALGRLPKKPEAVRERFEVPKAEVVISGKRTFIHNFKQICDKLNRPPRHVLRFILRELAAPGTIEGSSAIIQGEIPKSTIDKLIERYYRRYVVCPICGRPDTFLVKERRIYFIVCGACGAKSSVPPII
ncbi:MAG: translation initiation factor IF-2 subunit beta [Thermofilum sp. ex4484_15]|nr:MAG: translation initiation factor IF-2 subunit beta [Thermofilum sp. ex4484_15]